MWAYVAAARLLALRPRRVRLPAGGVEVLPGPTLLFQTAAVPPAPALFAWHLVVEGRHSARRTFEIRRPLDAEVLVPLDLPRGSYATTVRWELADTFGFTRGGPRHRWTTTVVVPSVPEAFVPPRPPAIRTGAWHPRRTGRRAGDPFDVRRYAPGDDLRRLHWPLYAHSGVPFVRTADPSPPPMGRWHLILDTEAGTEQALDRRLGALARWLTDLEAQGTPWLLEIPAIDQSLGPGSSWVEALAALSPAPLPERPPQTSETGLTLVTGPGSRGALRWTGLLTVAQKDVRPVVIPEPAASPPARRPWWAR